MRNILLSAAITAFVVLGTHYGMHPAHQPTESVLVGTGCEGEFSTLVALEEDMFPLCKVIEPHVIIKEYAK